MYDKMVTERIVDVVVCGGFTGAEVADRHHSYGSYLYYNIGDSLNLIRLYRYLCYYSQCASMNCTVIG